MKKLSYFIQPPLLASLSFFVLLVLLCLSACSPIYVMQSAYYEGKILLGREPIENILSKPEDFPDIDQEMRLKLAAVLAAGEFAEEIGFPPEGSYQAYSEMNRNPLIWLLMGSQKTAFEPKTWWFPIVGSVPYKGFFDKDDALHAEKKLQSDGYETRLRGSDAFSTLGWFNDPILTGVLKRPLLSVSNTVLHELFHQHIWIPGSVPFNESAAHYFSLVANRAFAERVQSNSDFLCGRLPAGEKATCGEKIASLLVESERIFEQEVAVAAALQNLYRDLQRLYKSKQSDEEKLLAREVLFQKHAKKLQQDFPGMRVLQEMNNAEILQLVTYLSGFPSFEKLFAECLFSQDLPASEGNWRCIQKSMMRVRDKSDGKPFTFLKGRR